MTPEFGTSRDPLKALTSLPRRLFRWAWRRGCFPRQNRGWIPLEQAEQDGDGDGDGDGDEEVASGGGGGPTGARMDGESQPRAVGGVGGGSTDFEPLEEEEGGAGVRRGVVIKGLRKEFGSKVAVAGLDLRLRVGDITCLLGHNGAGESVTRPFAAFFNGRCCLVGTNNIVRVVAGAVWVSTEPPICVGDVFHLACTYVATFSFRKVARQQSAENSVVPRTYIVSFSFMFVKQL